MMRDWYWTHRITPILNRVEDPNTSRAEKAFAALQEKYNVFPEYGYDAASLWRRATTRSLNLISLEGIELPGKQILDVGAGDGMLGMALEAFGHSVKLLDQEDWRHESARNLNLYVADCCKPWPFANSSFDLICSYNSFEHFPDPFAVLSEMVRVLKPNGWIYAEFGPLFASPWGLHAYRSLRMPYPQFLFSEEFVLQKLEEIGISDLGKKRTELQFLNRWKPDDFENLWRSSNCRIVAKDFSTNVSELGIVTTFPEAFRGRNLKFEDLTVSSISVALKKDG